MSSQRQVHEGKGLESQETRCRNFCKGRNFQVEKVFQDEGISGGLFERPAMRQLLDYIDANPHKKYVVVFDDLKRFARDYQVHISLKLELVKSRGVKLECLNFNFEDTPEGEFVEGILALSGKLERKQNRRQVVQKMKARIDRGYWPFCPPPALVNKRDAAHGKILVANEPYASIFKQAIEGYAFNLFNTKDEVRQFVLKKYSEHGIRRPLSDHGVGRILRNPLYAGYIEYTPWDVPLADGQHEGFITKEVFHSVQEKMDGRITPKVNNYNSDFPLRGFVTCSECGHKLYGSKNRGNGGIYPNYWCPNRECKYKGKVVKAYDMHPQFESLLQTAKVEKENMDLGKQVFSFVWEQKKLELQKQATAKGYRKRELDASISSLVEKVSSAQSDAVVRAYEKKIEELSKELDDLDKGNTNKKKFDQKGLDVCWNRVQKQLENPLSLWKSENDVDKSTVLCMYFNKGLHWHYKKGFRTAKISDEISLLQDLKDGSHRDVEMARSDLASEIAAPISSTDIVNFCYCARG